MQQLRDKWIEEVLESTRGARAPESNPYLHTRVWARLEQTARRATVSPRWVLAAATGFCILVMLNVTSLRRPQRNAPPVSNEQGITQVIQEYGMQGDVFF